MTGLYTSNRRVAAVARPVCEGRAATCPSLLGGKIATHAAHHDQGLPYTLYLLTFTLDSVGDVFGSVFLIAAGLRLVRIRVLPHWLAWIAVPGGTFCSCRALASSGVTDTLGLVLDLIASWSLSS
jgi:hypothetical protein